jgi:hypothetical protein
MLHPDRPPHHLRLHRPSFWLRDSTTTPLAPSSVSNTDGKNLIYWSPLSLHRRAVKLQGPPYGPHLRRMFMPRNAVGFRLRPPNQATPGSSTMEEGMSHFYRANEVSSHVQVTDSSLLMKQRNLAATFLSPR